MSRDCRLGDAYLPITARHPAGKNTFRQMGETAEVDLGWFLVPGFVVVAVAVFAHDVLTGRTFIAAERSMYRVDKHFGDSRPIACGVAVSRPGHYFIAYPVAQIRVLPDQVVVNGLSKFGWLFTRSATVSTKSFGPFSSTTFAEGEVRLRVRTLGHEVPAGLRRATWLVDRA